MKKIFFRVSEFAKICGVSKHTLYHYDDLGLLKPEKTAENGYRLYTMTQYDTFQIISLLKEIGMNLEEIRDYLNQESPEILKEILKKRMSEFREYARSLALKSAQLVKMVRALDSIDEENMGRIRVMYCSEEKLIITKAPDSEGYSIKEYADRISDHFRFCSQYNTGIHTHVGEIVRKEDYSRGIFQESFYYSRCISRTCRERLAVKEAGMYAVTWHRGGYDSLAEAYRNFLVEVAAQGYRIAGDLYQEDVINALCEPDRTKFISKISVRIETGKK